MKILKVGGSFITDKSPKAFEILKKEKISEICNVIAENYRNLVIVHGVGSFGHPHVKIYGLSSEISISKIHMSCLRLNLIFCEELLKRDVPVLPLHPIERVSCEVIKESVKKGFVPVLHGDVNLEFKIISGDDLAIDLAEKLNAKILGFITDVEGVIVGGKVVEKFYPEMLKELDFKDDKVDVTGGMRKKLEKILNSNVKCRVFIFKGDAENLRKFLNNKPVGTEVCRL